jgi:SAM-dependent methyltransferase
MAARSNPKGRYQSYSGEALPFSESAFDVVFAICVMHHVPPPGWGRFVQEMQRVTRPGGLTVVFEHNPKNPLTRRAVNRCPFDADAVLLPLRTTRALFEQAQLEVVERRYILFFPWQTRIFQWMEHRLRGLPLGGQYYVVGRKADSSEPTGLRRAA